MIHIIQEHLAQIIHNIMTSPYSIYYEPLADQHYHATPSISIIPQHAKIYPAWNNPHPQELAMIQEKYHLKQEIHLILTVETHHEAEKIMYQLLQKLPRYIIIQQQSCEMIPLEVQYHHTQGVLDHYSATLSLMVDYTIYQLSDNIPSIKNVSLNPHLKEETGGGKFNTVKNSSLNPHPKEETGGGKFNTVKNSSLNPHPKEETGGGKYE